LNFKHTIIAEIGSAHDGSFGNACKLIELASKCGADIVKFQTHLAEFETLNDAFSPSYFSSEPRMDYFKRTAFTEFQWNQIAKCCHDNKVQFLSSPFSCQAVDLLEKAGVDAYKIASGEVTNLPLLQKIASCDKPVFLSSGMSSWDELDAAVDILSDVSAVVMQCSSVYPCPPEKTHLHIIEEMQRKYEHCLIGFSDHTIGSTAAIIAIAFGAQVVEKHFAFSRHMYGSDACHSMEPAEFAEFCANLKDAWTMTEDACKNKTTKNYAQMKYTFEKKIVLSKPLKKGHLLALDDLDFKKTSQEGINVSKYEEVLGQRLRVGLQKDAVLKWTHFQKEK
jgi:N-acetylneuraminate synthase